MRFGATRPCHLRGAGIATGNDAEAAPGLKRSGEKKPASQTYLDVSRVTRESRRCSGGSEIVPGAGGVPCVHSPQLSRGKSRAPLIVAPKSPRNSLAVTDVNEPTVSPV
jgi:hypothetical protein